MDKKHDENCQTTLILATPQASAREGVSISQVERLDAMQPHSTGYYVSSTAFGAVFGAGAGFLLGKAFGKSGEAAAEMAVETGLTIGIIQFFEAWAEDRKVRNIKQELDAKYGEKGR